MNRSFAYPIAIFTIALLLAACGEEENATEASSRPSRGNSEPASQRGATPPPTSTATPRPVTPTASPEPEKQTGQPVDPLCGRPIQETSLIERRPLAVKIDNAPDARPQSGLSQACTVYEHITEWGVTRYTAIYLAEDAETVGPIRSGRLIDLGIVLEYDAIFAHFGGNESVQRAYRSNLDADLDLYSDATLYYRSGHRWAPSNAYSSTAHLRQRSRELGLDRASARLSGNSFSTRLPPGGEEAFFISIPYSLSSRVEYRYDSASNSYQRFLTGQPHLDEASGSQLRVTNVVVQYVASHPTETLDINGQPTLRFDITGEGVVEVFRDGRVYQGRWVRSSLTERTRFLDEDGNPIPFRPGNIWISVVRPDMAVGRKD